MAEVLECEYDNCKWKSAKGDLSDLIKLYEIHLKVKHSNAQTTSKPEKAKRPELSAESSDEDWLYFVARWKEYKKATGLTGDDVIIQLMECCCESLRRDHHRTFSKLDGDTVDVTESQRLEELKQLAVKKRNKAVNRVKLGTLRQDKGEPVRKFVGRVRSLAVVSDYKVQCKGCKSDVFYSEEVIIDQVIRGLANAEIQRDVLSHLDADKLTLDKLLTFIEGKESGEASQGLLANSTVGVSNAVIPDKKCSYCGDSHKRGKKFCKAANFKCDCGKIGHFAKVCRSKGKTLKNGPNESECSAQDDKKEQVEAAWGVPDGHWACQIDVEQLIKLPESLDFIENRNTELYTNYLNANEILKKKQAQRFQEAAI